MHPSAMFYGRRFFETYCPSAPAADFTVVEIGSQNVNGSLRDVCPAGGKYIGLDFVEGNGVDVVISDPYKLPIADASADIVVSSSCFEHSEFFWLVFLEALRILKPEGVFYLNIPSNGFFHQWPVDCWRFYPDSGHALVAWAHRQGLDGAMLLESFVGQRSDGRVSQGGMWNDFVAVFLKDQLYKNNYPQRIVHSLTDYSNGYSSEVDSILNHNERGPDFSLIESQMEQLDARAHEVQALSGSLAERDSQIDSLRESMLAQDVQVSTLEKNLEAATKRCGILEQEWQAKNERIASLEQDLVNTLNTVCEMKKSRSWRITAPCRFVGRLTRPFARVVRRILWSPFRLLAKTGILSRLITGFLLLPAALVFYGGLLGFCKQLRLRRNSGIFAQVVAEQAVVRERMSIRGRVSRRFVFSCFSAATYIFRVGSVSKAMCRFLSIATHGGWAGVKSRLAASVPSQNVSFVTPLSNSVLCRILVADYCVPRADMSAGELATVGILKDLCALGYEVVFLPNNMLSSPKYEKELCAMGVTVVTEKSGYQNSAHYVAANGHRFGVFYIIRVDVAESILPTVRRVAPQARVIFHAPDLYFLREMRQAELSHDQTMRWQALQMRNREVDMMRSSDHVVVVSPAELPILRAELPDVPISVFPVLYAPIVPNPKEYAERQHIFFLGGFGHTPNINAVQWFAKEVWPAIRVSLPDVEFHIVGAEPPEEVLALGNEPGIKVVGFVPDLTPVLETYRLGVAPLLFGAGIKGKVAMTLGAGIPCVCTDIAAEGMNIEDGVHGLLANDPEAFSAAVIHLYNDAELWARLSQNGQKLVADHFGDAANRASLTSVLDQANALPLSLFCDYCKSAETLPIPEPEQGADVDVSIIIPVYNKWHLTRACLTSIVQTSVGCGVRYEVILADDGSTDATTHASEFFPGLKVVKTQNNMGFLRNCNNAAKQARGQHILLLNNDTVVLPGWLAALYQTIKNDVSIAIVGSKLLYPDGDIQEAGAALFNNGTALNIGRGAARNTCVFNIEREVDYISGASILIRKSFWQAVGGFDERYKIAYCEDSDLAMMARAHGLRVVYQPKSEVIHFEHQSYAEQAPSHNTKLQDHNIALLVEKWKDIFAQDHLSPCEWPLAAANAERSVPAAVAARRARGQLNLLYFSPFPSHPASHGNRATILQFARSFQGMGHHVHFVLLESNDFNDADVRDMKAAWDTLDILPFANPMVANGDDIAFDGWYEEGVGEQIRILCAKYEIDIVFCSYIFQSKLLEFVPDYVLKVIDTHDKMGDRYDMLQKNGQPLEFFSCSPEEEGVYLRRADVVVARREEEAEYFDSVSGMQSAIVIPHVELPQFIEKEYVALNKVGVVASANRINLAIVKECLEAIERSLHGGACPFTVHVAGQVKDMVALLPLKDAAIFKKPWVKLRGFIPDITAFYAEMDVMVSPVTMGTGINVKTVQAMAYGMPLLTTLCGGKGIETNEPLHQHADLNALATSLFLLSKTPDQLARLARISRERYQIFYENSQQSMAALFKHPKLEAATRAVPEFAPIEMRKSAESPSVSVMQYRHAREASLQASMNGGSGLMPAVCCLCGQAHFVFTKDYGWMDPAKGGWQINWREQLICPRCGLNSRMRAIAHVLQAKCPIPRDGKVYINEQTTRLYEMLKERFFPGLIGSEYLGDRCVLGESHKGIRNEDMTQLSFSDGELAAVLSFDVLEHIPDFQTAIREVYRCLQPGGYFIFSAPFNPDSEKTLIRARISANGTIEHLVEPEYHGDPINPEGGVLCFQTFGWEILDQVREAGFSDAYVLDCWSELFGYMGNSLVFVAMKS